MTFVKGKVNGVPFKPGENNPGGVPKITREVRKQFAEFLSNNLPNLQIWIEEVAKTNPAKALDIICNYAQYVLPRLQITDVVSDGKPINIILPQKTEDIETIEINNK